MHGNPHVGLPINHTGVPHANMVALNNVRDDSMTQTQHAAYHFALESGPPAEEQAALVNEAHVAESLTA
ncbi:hypothetical protein G7054_g10090 [Neopestalotiopsis clavispora]|nr:hypothetical protein G7054_g10090 [Neopestalotiopsis clavispora]